MKTDEHGVLTREEMNKVTKEWVEKSSKFWMARDKEHELVAQAQHDHDVAVVERLPEPIPYGMDNEYSAVFEQGWLSAINTILAALGK